MPDDHFHSQPIPGTVKRSALKWILGTFPYVLLVFAVIHLGRQLALVEWSHVTDEFLSVNPLGIVAALVLLAINYLVFIAYDLTSIRQLKVQVPLKNVAHAAVLSFGVSNVLGHSMITGLGFRYREYSRFGMTLTKTTGIVVQNVEAWWVGFAFFCGLVYIEKPLGWLLLALIVAYLSACYLFHGRQIQVWKFRPRLPDFKSGLSKVAVASTDVAVTSLTLYVLLPKSLNLSFFEFLPLYVLAQVSGVVSMVPGGLGVIETVLLQLLKPYGGSASIFVALLLYRLIHYILPMILVLAFEALRAGTFRRTPREEAFAKEEYGT